LAIVDFPSLAIALPYESAPSFWLTSFWSCLTDNFFLLIVIVCLSSSCKFTPCLLHAWNFVPMCQPIMFVGNYCDVMWTQQKQVWAMTLGTPQLRRLVGASSVMQLVMSLKLNLVKSLGACAS
jgi:hypothetical protein